MFSIDGKVWDVPCQIEREAQMRPSEISGMLLDRTYFNDVLGTYMSYQVSIAVPFNRAHLYYEIYNSLTDPVDAHTFVLPHSDGNITVTGRVESVSDSWVRMPGDANHWRNIHFTVTANHPSRCYRLNEVISRGQSDVPSIDLPPDAVLVPLSVTANGSYTPGAGVDGFDGVVVNVPTSAPNLQSKTVTQNGVVTPDSGYDGLSSVTVDVQDGGGAGIPLNLRAQAFISSGHTVSWENGGFPAYQQFWLDLQPYQGVTLTVVNTGNRNLYGFTSTEPRDGLALNAARADSGGSLTVTYDGGANRYLVYDFSASFDGGRVTVSTHGGGAV